MNNYDIQRKKLRDMIDFNCSSELIFLQKQLVKSLRPQYAREDEM